ERMINIVLLGGSNSVGRYGLQKGLSQDNVKLHNLALGSTTSIQNLYELKRTRNASILKSADLIISESNVNEYNSFSHKYERLPLHIIYRNLFLLYSELSKLNKKILILLLPRSSEAIDGIHKYFVNKFNFNIIDINSYYKNKNITDLIAIEGSHPFWTFMRELGVNIVHNIHCFHLVKNECDNPFLLDFKICDSCDMKVISGDVVKKKYNNSVYSEEISQLQKDTVMVFPKKYYGYYLLAVHTWNKLNENINIKSTSLLKNYSIVKICNQKYKISKVSNFLNSVVEFQEEHLEITADMTLCISLEDVCITEFHHAAHTWENDSKCHNTLDLVSFFLLKKDCDIAVLKNTKISQEINKKCIFNHIIPPMEKYKEIL
ncbi:hypothetical protein, partial [Campylobacter lari]|uniref:hypothetical protein n=1 Tax=Campylobacter lari TaxID=201 RepID=UPI001BDB3B04